MDTLPTLTEAEIEGLDIEGEELDASELLEDLDDGPGIYMPGGVDEAELLDELYKDLLRGDRARQVLAEAETRKVAEFNQMVEHRTMEGLGQVVASVPLSVFLYWAGREGQEFWHDRSNIDFLARRAVGTGGVAGNPGIVPRTVVKPTIVVDKPFPQACEEPAVCGVEQPAAVMKGAAAGSARRVGGKRGRWAR